MHRIQELPVENRAKISTISVKRGLSTTSEREEARSCAFEDRQEAAPIEATPPWNSLGAS